MKTLGCCLCPEASSSSSSSSVSSSAIISTVGTDCGDCNPIPRRWRLTIPAAGGSTHTCHSTVAGNEYVVHFHTNIFSICQYGSDIRYKVGDCSAPAGSGPCSTAAATVNQTNFIRMWVSTNTIDRQYLVELHYHIDSPSSTGKFGEFKLVEPIANDCFADKSLADQSVTGCQHTWSGNPLLMTVEP